MGGKNKFPFLRGLAFYWGNGQVKRGKMMYNLKAKLFQYISWHGGVVWSMANYPFASNWHLIAITHPPDARNLIKSSPEC